MKLTYSITLMTACAAACVLAGCASTSESSTAGSKSSAASAQIPSRYKADDGRTIEIGRSAPGDGGMTFRDPHMEKCWIADGFTFNGYDTLYIAPTTSS